MLVASEQAVKAHGLKPRARIHHMSVRGDDPIFMLSGPIPATRYALQRSGMSLDGNFGLRYVRTDIASPAVIDLREDAPEEVHA